jgi:hypothetical protein
VLIVANENVPALATLDLALEFDRHLGLVEGSLRPGPALATSTCRMDCARPGRMELHAWSRDELPGGPGVLAAVDFRIDDRVGARSYAVRGVNVGATDRAGRPVAIGFRNGAVTIAD